MNFDREGVGDGSFYDWIPDVEARQFEGFDEKGKPRSLNGRLTDTHQVLGSNASAFAKAQSVPDIHKVRCSAAKIAYKEQQDFSVGRDGGYMIPIHSKIGQGTRIHFEKLLNEDGRRSLIPVYPEQDALNFYLNREVKSEEIYSVNYTEQYLEKEIQQSGNEYGRAVRS